MTAGDCMTVRPAVAALHRLANLILSILSPVITTRDVRAAARVSVAIAVIYLRLS